jgi:prepilin-type N-terminal cleavage/methylation domain-containing protein
MKNKKSGFTLIELLVVVLIIGILAAIALPQYQFAVAKIKAAKGFTIVKNLEDATERYRLLHGKYPDTATAWNDLDISFPYTPDKYGYIRTPDYTLSVSISNAAVVQFNNLEFALARHYNPQTYGGKYFCRFTGNTSQVYKKICDTLCNANYPTGYTTYNSYYICGFNNWNI